MSAFNQGKCVLYYRGNTRGKGDGWVRAMPGLWPGAASALTTTPVTPVTVVRSMVPILCPLLHQQLPAVCLPWCSVQCFALLVYIISPPLLLLHYSMSHETKWLRCVLWFIKQNCNNSRNKVTKLTIFAWFRYLKLFRSRHLQAKTRHHISTSTEFQIQLALWRRKSISVKWKVKRDWMQIMN